ncbi:MAG: ZIP family metal transporter, partial [Rubripirellula sp.]
MTTTLLVVYCVLIIIASVMGGWLPALMRMTHLRTQLLMSFVAGLMLGIAMLHMLPHSSHLLKSGSASGAAALAGIIVMFIFLRAFHAHQHDDSHAPTPACDHDDHEHDHSHEHDHAHD